MADENSIWSRLCSCSEGLVTHPVGIGGSVSSFHLVRSDHHRHDLLWLRRITPSSQASYRPCRIVDSAGADVEPWRFRGQGGEDEQRDRPDPLNSERDLLSVCVVDFFVFALDNMG